MKLVRQDRNVETFGLQENTGFKIKATAKAFEILSSGLYKDKITAILREISANAKDAHTDAGIADVPFDVHLPTTLEPFLSIRDYGKGLTHELMLTLYQMYFGSLKEETNDLIGGLGLGSKSPFAYTDAYTVVSRTDKRRTYDLYKDENGEPQIALRSTEELKADEKTGLEVIVPLANGYDAREFINKSVAVYEHYPVLPNFTGASFPGVQSYKTLLEGKGWKITDRPTGHYSNSNARVIMGVISYPIDGDSVVSVEDGHAIKDLARAKQILKAPLDIEFPIGSLDITAGREELSYVKQTKSELRRRLVQIADEIAAKVASEFKACESLYEAKKLYAKLFAYGAPLTNALGNGFEVEFRGQKIKDTLFNIDMKDFPKSKLILYKDSKRGSHRFTMEFKAPSPPQPGRYHDQRHSTLSIDAQERIQTQLFFDDLGGVGHHNARMFNYRQQNNLVKCVLIQTECKSELKKLKALLDGFTVKNLSDAPKPTYERTYTKAKLLTLPRRAYSATRTDDIRGPRSGTWSETDITVEDGGIYVLTSRHRIIHDNNEDADEIFSRYFHLARRLGLIGDDEAIVAVPLSQSKQFTNTKKYEGKWTSFFDLFKARSKKLLTKDAQQVIVNGRAREEFDCPARSHGDFVELLDAITAQLKKRHPINEFRKDFVAADGSSSGLSWVDLDRVAKMHGLNPKGSATDFNAKWQLIFDQYPMLRFALDYYNPAEFASTMADYIKLVDQTR